jgi:hypothetical protein
VRRRRLSEAERRNLTVRQGELSALAQHPSWPVLAEEVNRKQARIERVLVAKALSKDGLDDDDGAYLRGFIHGMRWFASVPEQAEDALENFLKRQGISTEGAS